MARRQAPGVRLAALVLLSVLVLGPGCLDAFDQMGPAMDCSGDSVWLDEKFATVLLGDEVPREVRAQGDAPVGTAMARPGQTVSAVVVYRATGAVAVRYDGPMDNVTVSEANGVSAWQAQGVSPGGSHTLELVGEPMAINVGFALVLYVGGCTPAPPET